MWPSSQITIRILRMDILVPSEWSATISSWFIFNNGVFDTVVDGFWVCFLPSRPNDLPPAPRDLFSIMDLLIQSSMDSEFVFDTILKILHRFLNFKSIDYWMFDDCCNNSCEYDLKRPNVFFFLFKRDYSILLL